MGFWDALTGRHRVKGPDLDSLFLVPSDSSRRTYEAVIFNKPKT